MDFVDLLIGFGIVLMCIGAPLLYLNEQNQQIRQEFKTVQFNAVEEQATALAAWQQSQKQNNFQENDIQEQKQALLNNTTTVAWLKDRISFLLDRPKISAVNLLKPRKNVSIYFFGAFSNESKTVLLTWLNETFFCHSFQETSFNETFDLYITTHNALPQSVQESECGQNSNNESLTVNQTAGCFFTFNDKPAISLMPAPEVYGGAFEKGVFTHELAHYLGLDIHGVSKDNKLEYSEWDLPLIQAYMKTCG